MILELTLVKTQTPYSPVGTFLERKRFDVADQVDAMAAVVKFLGDNVDIINSMVVDKNFVSLLSSLKPIPADTFNCIRAILSQSNLDLWAWIVAENEVNAMEPTEEAIEYNVVDYNMSMTESLKFCTKFVMPSENLSYSKLYESIQTSFGLFSPEGNEIFASVANPYDSLLSAIKTIERPIGAVSNNLIVQLSELLKFLGKNMYVVLNQ